MQHLEVLIVGGGGREHAIAIGLSASPSVSAIHCCPGNAGTSMVGKNHNIGTSDIDSIASLAESLGVDLVVVGPEAPLVEGLSETLRSRGISCFGPHSEAAKLEGSKLHAKNIMNSLGVPTGKFQHIDSLEGIDTALDDFKPPWVVKRDVLASGKGVTVTENREEARSAMENALNSDGIVLIEQFLPGEEASVLVIMDETGYVTLPPSQDHKRAMDGESGPNTGGMGAYAPAPVATPSVMARVHEEIIEPMHSHLSLSESPYRGCLYVGLMIDSDGSPSVVEFNVRFGDPETQVTIPLISSDLGEALLATAEGRLSDYSIEFNNLSAATVVLASEGYPSKPNVGREVTGWNFRIEEGQNLGYVNIAGANFDDDGKMISDGGRVLSSTGLAPNLVEAIGTAYQIIEVINLDGSFHRSDIGYRALTG